jgi:hypothetical protein
VGGHIVRIRTVHKLMYSLYSSYNRTDLGTKIEAIFGTVFEAVSRFFVVVSGSYETVHTGDCGLGKRGTEEAKQQYGFGMENEVDFYGTDLVLRSIFLGWKCRFVVVLYFSEA